MNLTVSALACAIAKGKSNDEVTLLSVFFTQLGDSLATIAAADSICCGSLSKGEQSPEPAEIV